MDRVLATHSPDSHAVNLLEVLQVTLRKLRDYTLLIKLKLSLLVVASTLTGFWLASSHPISTGLFAATAFGVLFIVAGANVVNEILEREPDARMKRTSIRPLPSHRMSVEEAAWAASIFTVLGFGLLLAFVNWVTALLGLAAYLLYVLAYTPLKKKSPLCVLVGAFPGAIPAMMGPSAVHGQITQLSWLLFGIVFLWQFPHFAAIAWVAKEDYAKAGFRMLVRPDNVRFTAYEILLFACALVGISPLMTAMRQAGSYYFFGSIALSLFFLAMAVVFWIEPSQRLAKRVMGAALLYLPSLFFVMILDRMRFPW